MNVVGGIRVIPAGGKLTSFQATFLGNSRQAVNRNRRAIGSSDVNGDRTFG